MLFIFRKIRRSLMQKNKVTTYLFYSIGEIILVVIGILIALQVNGWDEHRKERNRAATYKASLINDLQEDSVSIANVLTTIEIGKQEFLSIQQRLKASSANLDTAYQIARYEVNLLADRIRPYNTNTFSALSSTGDINLLPKNIVDQLLDLRRNQQLSLELGQLTYETFWEAVSDFSYQLPRASQYSDNLVESGPLNDLFWESKTKQEVLELLNKAMSAKNNHYRISNMLLTEIQQQTHALLAELRK